VQVLSAQPFWSRSINITPLDDPLQREFYAEMSPAARLGSTFFPFTGA
jgi:hypothetical protein